MKKSMPEPAPIQADPRAHPLALAGKREIRNGAAETLDEGLTLAFDAIAARLGALADMAARKDDPLAERFVAGAKARLTLVTGLADGADQVAGEIFIAGEQPRRSSRGVLGAVLPCGRDAYVADSAIADTETFARQWEACAFVIELDGLMPPAPDQPSSSSEPSKAYVEAVRERAEAFSGQSELLLRHADILVAVDNLNDNGRVGGTRDTIQGAFDIGVPVILLRLGEPGLAVLRTRGDLEEPVMLPPGAAHEALADLVDDLVGVIASNRDADYVDALYSEFFATDVRRTGRLNHLWDWFDAGFKHGKGPFRHQMDRLRRAPRTRERAFGAGGWIGPGPAARDALRRLQGARQSAERLLWRAVSRRVPGRLCLGRHRGVRRHPVARAAALCPRRTRWSERVVGHHDRPCPGQDRGRVRDLPSRRTGQHQGAGASGGGLSVYFRASARDDLSAEGGEPALARPLVAALHDPRRRPGRHGPAVRLYRIRQAEPLATLEGRIDDKVIRPGRRIGDEGDP